jgi:hypothetical protein
MAKSIAKGHKHTQILKGQVLGAKWKEVLEDMLMKEGTKIARARLKETDRDKVVVQISASFFVEFARKDKAAQGVMRCACTFPQKGVCVCAGACDFDACCDLIVV